MAMWSPWHGCHKYSEGCKYCYVHKGDAKRGVDTNTIVKTDNNARPLNYNWVLSIREQCITKGVPFEFRQC